MAMCFGFHSAFLLIGVFLLDGNDNAGTTSNERGITNLFDLATSSKVLHQASNRERVHDVGQTEEACQSTLPEDPVWCCTWTIEPLMTRKSAVRKWNGWLEKAAARANM